MSISRGRSSLHCPQVLVLDGAPRLEDIPTKQGHVGIFYIFCLILMAQNETKSEKQTRGRLLTGSEWPRTRCCSTPGPSPRCRWPGLCSPLSHTCSSQRWRRRTRSPPSRPGNRSTAFAHVNAALQQEIMRLPIHVW